MLHRILRRRHAATVYRFVTAEAPMLAGIAIVSGLLLSFLWIADEVMEGDMKAVDDALLMVFRDPNNVDLIIGPPWLHEMVRDITALGSFALLGLIVAAVCCYLVLARMTSAAVLILVSVLSGTVLSTVLKMGYDRPRPDLVSMSHQFTASFPSGHAMLSAITFLTLGAILARIAPTRRLQIFSISAAVFLTMIVGVSRIFMGVHYPSDVLAGWCLGAAWALLCSIVAVILQRRGSIKEPAADEVTTRPN